MMEKNLPKKNLKLEIIKYESIPINILMGIDVCSNVINESSISMFRVEGETIRLIHSTTSEDNAEFIYKTKKYFE